jgi:hypothetical protein
VARPGGNLRQAGPVKRAFRARWLEDGEGDGAGCQQPAQISHRILSQLAQLHCEFHFAPAFARGVKDGSMGHRFAKHLFQAKRLGAQLRIIIFKAAASALFVLHRTKRTVAVLLDNVAPAGESEPLGKHRQRPKQLHALGDLVPGKVGMLMRQLARGGMHVLFPPTFNQLQPRAARAVEKSIDPKSSCKVEVIEEGKWQRFRSVAFNSHTEAIAVLLLPLLQKPLDVALAVQNRHNLEGRRPLAVNNLV